MAKNAQLKVSDLEKIMPSSAIRKSINNLIEKSQFTAVKLNAVMRQKDDVFIKILNCIRTGRNAEKAVMLLNKRANYADKSPDGFVQITPYNEVSDRTNQEKLDYLNSCPNHKVFLPYGWG